MGLLDIFKRKSAQERMPPPSFDIRSYDDLGAMRQQAPFPPQQQPSPQSPSLLSPQPVSQPEGMPVLPPLPSFDDDVPSSFSSPQQPALQQTQQVMQQAAQQEMSAAQPYEEFIPYKYEPIDEPRAEDFAVEELHDISSSAVADEPFFKKAQSAEQQPSTAPQQPQPNRQPFFSDKMPSTQFPDFLPPTAEKQFELFVSASNYDTFISSFKDIMKNLRKANDELAVFADHDDRFRKELFAFHDGLDVMQKKLMHIDEVLFEQ